MPPALGKGLGASLRPGSDRGQAGRVLLAWVNRYFIAYCTILVIVGGAYLGGLVWARTTLAPPRGDTHYSPTTPVRIEDVQIGSDPWGMHDPAGIPHVRPAPYLPHVNGDPPP